MRNDPVVEPGDVVPQEGIVRGRAIDEIDGEPVPFLEMSVDGEALETDATGAFVTKELHEGGRLEFDLAGWSYEVGDWDPELAEPLIVPARVGPTVYIALDRSATDLFAAWQPPGPVSSASACGIGERAFLRTEPPTFVRLRAEGRRGPQSGELVLVSYTDHLFGRVELGPDRGTALDPIPVSLRRCGFLSVSARCSRSPEWFEGERLTLVLLARDGDLLASQRLDPSRDSRWIVLDTGDHWLEARYEGEAIGRAPVTTHLGEIALVVLPVSLPELEMEEEPSEPAASVHVLVTSARNLPVECQLRLARRSDGREALIPVRWTEEGGRLLGIGECEAPAGEYRAVLEPSTPYAYSGPATVRVPAAEAFEFELDDDVPLVDVYFAPTAAETGAPLLAFDVAASLAGGEGIGSSDYSSPSVPVFEGHPSNVPFSWICSAPGRRPVCGRWEPDGGEGDLRLAVTLERGWGATLYVGDPDCLALEGVRVLGDGVPIAITDASGHACLGGARPRRLDLEYRDWVLDPQNLGEIELDGTFDDSWGQVRAYLKPPVWR